MYIKTQIILTLINIFWFIMVFVTYKQNVFCHIQFYLSNLFKRVLTKYILFHAPHKRTIDYLD